ncbi:hypothetical protein BASA62_007120 [Batrachochytrium salamandrivorans]|nr:hypothetical protein BASA62_007120 [Batrachochytrium salamandrivorans]
MNSNNNSNPGTNQESTSEVFSSHFVWHYPQQQLLQQQQMQQQQQQQQQQSIPTQTASMVTPTESGSEASSLNGSQSTDHHNQDLPSTQNARLHALFMSHLLGQSPLPQYMSTAWSDTLPLLPDEAQDLPISESRSSTLSYLEPLLPPPSPPAHRTVLPFSSPVLVVTPDGAALIFLGLLDVMGWYDAMALGHSHHDHLAASSHAIATQLKTMQSTVLLPPSQDDDSHSNLCSICLDGLHGSADLSLMPCGHIYHRPCILKWLKESNMCPYCRFELMTDCEDYNEELTRRRRESPQAHGNSPMAYGWTLDHSINNEVAQASNASLVAVPSDDVALKTTPHANEGSHVTHSQQSESSGADPH